MYGRRNLAVAAVFALLFISAFSWGMGISVRNKDTHVLKGVIAPNYAQSQRASVSISSPHEGDTYLSTDTIHFEGYQSDCESYEWRYIGDGSSHGETWWEFQLGWITPPPVLSTELSFDAPGSSFDPTQSNVWSICFVGYYDNGNNYTLAVVNIYVQMDYPPVPVISQPDDGGYYVSTQDIQFDASGSYDTNGQSLSFTWTSNIDGEIGTTATFSKTLSAGDHTITLEVSDGANDPVSTHITVHVLPPNEPPVVEITSPDQGGATADTSFSIEWSVTDENTDTASVTISIYYDTDTQPGGRTAIVHDTANTGSYEWDTTDVPEGEYFIYIEATDHPVYSVLEPKTGSAYSMGTVSISHDKPPTDPANIQIIDNHDTTPTLIWDPSTDPEGGGVKYYITIGTYKGGDDVVANDMTTQTSYTVPNVLDFGPDGREKTYYVTLHAEDSKGHASNDVEFTFTLVNHLPTAPEVEITPEEPRTGDNVHVTIKEESTDSDKDPITYKYVWYKNDVEYTEYSGDTLPSDATTKGDRWSCRVVPYDGYAEGAYAEVSFTIANTLPKPIVTTPSEGSVFAMDPETLDGPEVNFDASASTDADGDTLTFQWQFGDGESALGPSPKHQYTRAGDYNVQVIVSDGQGSVIKEINISVVAPVLSITDINFEAEDINNTAVGDQVKITAVITNTGEGEARHIDVMFYDNGVKIDKKSTTIQAGQTKSVYIYWTPTKSGKHNIKVELPLFELDDVASITINKGTGVMEGEDSDGDGMADNWETIYGLQVGINDAKADKDGDGYTNLEEYKAGTDPSDPEDHPTEGGEASPDVGTKIVNTLKSPLTIVVIIIVVVIIIILAFFLHLHMTHKREMEEKKKQYLTEQERLRKQREEKRKAMIAAQMAEAQRAAALAQAKQAELMKPVVEQTLKELEEKKKKPIVIVKKEKPPRPGEMRKVGEKLVVTVRCSLCGRDFDVDYGEHEATCPYCGEENIVPEGGEIKKVEAGPSVAPMPGPMEAQGLPESKPETTVTCSLCGKSFNVPPGQDVATCPYCGEENKVG